MRVFCVKRPFSPPDSEREDRGERVIDGLLRLCDELG